jgi:hypothetical protein
VTLRYEPGTLVAEVRNPRRPARAASAGGGAGGQGIIGLRERVRVIGGLLRAGPDGPDYRVVAILPYQAKATEPEQAPAPTAVPAPAGLWALADPKAAATTAGVPPPRGRPWTVWAGVACILLLFAASVLLSTRTNSMYLSKAVYDSVQVGQPERAVIRRLPHQLLPGPQDPGCKVFWVLPSDAGADRGLNTRYRLCFGGGVLVSKQELRS